MSLNRELNLSELHALSVGIESLLRRLLRILVGHISLTKLEEMVRLVFIEEVESKLRQEFPNKSISLAQLALLTDLDTRTLNRIRASSNYNKERSNEPNFMRHFTPTTRLLDKWSTDPRFLSEETGKPIPISIYGETASIEQLMREAKFMRGVTPKSIADRLLLSGAAILDEKSQKLKMVTDRFLPSASTDVEGAIEVGFNAIGRLVDTVFKNLEGIDADDERLYQRSYWTNRLAPQQRSEFRNRLTNLMREFEEEATDLLIKYEMHIDLQSQITAGFGLYYFEDSPDADE